MYPHMIWWIEEYYNDEDEEEEAYPPVILTREVFLDSKECKDNDYDKQNLDNKDVCIHPYVDLITIFV